MQMALSPYIHWQEDSTKPCVNQQYHVTMSLRKTAGSEQWKLSGMKNHTGQIKKKPLQYSESVFCTVSYKDKNRTQLKQPTVLRSEIEALKMCQKFRTLNFVNAYCTIMFMKTVFAYRRPIIISEYVNVAYTALTTLWSLVVEG